MISIMSCVTVAGKNMNDTLIDFISLATNGSVAEQLCRNIHIFIMKKAYSESTSYKSVPIKQYFRS